MTQSRHVHVSQIDALLEEIAEQRQRLYVLSTYGVQPAGLRPIKRGLHDSFSRVADLGRAA